MAVKPPEWLGAPESARLEYKSATALDHPETIVKAVVALLNCEGGQVVVGVDDDGHPRGLGDRDPARSRDRLQALLTDNIEPRPLMQVEVRLEEALGEHILVVEVDRSDAETLYGERRHGLYGFWVRSGPTTRAYQLHEIRQHLARTPTLHPDYPRWDQRLVARGETDTVLVLQAQTADLDLRAVDAVLAEDARRSLSRREPGWAVLDEYDRVERRPGKQWSAGGAGERKWFLADGKSGVLRFEGRSDFLRWKPHPAFSEPVIYPFPLAEGTASFFWLLARYAEEARADGEVRVELGLWRPGGWRLGPHRPRTIAWDMPTRWQPPHDNSSIEYAANLRWSELREGPDAAAYPFVAEVYEDFGYAPDAMPFWDEAQRVFRFVV